MALILNTTDVVCEVDRLVVRDDGELVGGSEPYLWSVFFKIDGSGVAANLHIDNLSASLSLTGEASVSSPTGSHGNILNGSSVDAGGLDTRPRIVSIPSRTGRFKTRLRPIPLTITLEPGSWLAEQIDDAVLSVQEFLDWMSSDQGCPQVTEPSQQLAQFGAEFITSVVGGIPGAFGAAYVLMEEDFVSEDAAENGRRAFRDALESELNHTIIPGISLSNQEVSDSVQEEIEIRVQGAVFDAVLAAIRWWELLSYADPDDPLGQLQAQMSHLDIALGQEQEIDKDFSPNGHGKWSVRGRLGPA